MFTGLIEEIGIVKGIRPSGDGCLLEISSGHIMEGIKTGDSISINGACQTVANLGNNSFEVFVSKVTRSVTTLGNFKPGSRVNLERAMQSGGRFGGHFVQGHVDGMGRITSIARDARGIEIDISVDREIHKYIAGKGSIAVDGISLTVVSLTGNGFKIYLIPESINRTIGSEWKSGDFVNIEADILAKYVERMIDGNKSKNDNDDEMKKKLMEEGFI